MDVQDFFRALFVAGLPMFVLSFLMVWWALHRGRLDGASFKELQKSIESLDKRRKEQRKAAGKSLPRQSCCQGKRQRGGAYHQCPVFSMLAQGSAGGRLSPACSSSTETLSGERTKAMRPSRGGRLMVTPLSIRCWHMS